METLHPDLALDQLANQLDLYRVDPARAALPLAEAVERAAREIASWNQEIPNSQHLPRALELSRMLWSAGYLGDAKSGAHLDLAAELAVVGWPGQIASMMLAPSWQWDKAPDLQALPAWLWPHFVQWNYIAPSRLEVDGAVDRHLARLESMAESIDRLAGANMGANGVPEVVEAFVRGIGTTAPLRSTRSLLRWSTARVAVFRKSIRHRVDRALAPRAVPREGRKLRVGAIAKDWSESLEARSRFAWLAGLAPEEFTVCLYGEKPANDALAQEFRKLAGRIQLLPKNPGERVDLLRAANLDVLVHTGNFESIADLNVAVQRIAPLQISLGECAWSTGLQELDLHLTPQNTDAGEFSTAVGLLPYQGKAWEAEIVAPELAAVSRESLGLPANGPVLVSGVSVECISGETLQAWARILQSVADSTLLLLPPAGSDMFELEQILLQFQSATGLAAGRIVVSVGDPRPSLALGALYLDSFPLSCPLPVQAALAIGTPIVVWEGKTLRSREGANVLRASERADAIAQTEEEYVRLACAALAQAKNTDGVSPSGAIWGVDLALAGAGIGELILRAYDRLASGRRLPAVWKVDREATPEFDGLEAAQSALGRKDAVAIVQHARRALVQDPSSSDARGLLVRAHMMSGFLVSAEHCAFANLRGREQEAPRWLEVGQVLRAKKEFSGAISAFETALRLEPRCVDGWLGIAELAHLKGADDLAADAVGMARRIDPRDPRLVALGA